MLKSPKAKSTQTKAPKTNEKGEIISWDSTSADGKALRALFDGGLITEERVTEETAKRVKKDFPRFRNYANPTLNSALSNERKRLEKESDTQQARGSAVLKSHSNLNINLGTINEEGDDDDSEEDGEFVVEDEVSEVSMDEYSFDTVTTAYKSAAHKAKKAAARRALQTGEAVSAPKLVEKIHGNTKIGLPYLLDLWRDCCSHARISVQVQMLSGRDAYKKIFVRVSTDGKELVLTLPMSPYMSRSDFAFNTFLLAEQHPSVSDVEQQYLKILLKHHPKCAARMVAVSKVKGRSYTDGFFYEQRIRLPRNVQHEFATQQSGDDLFTGKKFVEYPDGSVFLHVELVAIVKDNYIPEERMLDPKYMKSVPKNATTAGPMDVDGSTARVLPNHDDDNNNNNNNSNRIPKRTRTDDDPVVETVTEESLNGDDDGEDDGNMSTVTGPNAAAAASAAAAQAEAEAEAKAFQEAARNKAASILQQADADQQKKTSLERAVEQGKQAANGH